jgi:ankyrin repeat protein
MHASQEGKTDTVTVLLEKGANIEAKDPVRTPQHSTLFQSVSS